MKTLKYESELVLPDEIDLQLKSMERRILDDLYEPDKVLCNIGNFRGYLIRWFADKQQS